MLEYVAKAAKTHLEADMEAALDAIEVEWATDPITLPDVVTWHLGHLPTVVELARASFPVVTVGAFNEDPSPDPYTKMNQWGLGEGTVPLIVNWFIDDDDQETCYKKCLRFGQAIDAIIREHRKLDTGIEVETKSFVSVTRVSTLAREYPDLGDLYYTEMGQKTYSVRVRHTT